MSTPPQQQLSTVAAKTPPLLSPFGTYPNLLNLTDEHRKLFHPVIIFPEGVAPTIVDLTRPSLSSSLPQQLATEEQRQLSAQGKQWQQCTNPETQTLQQQQQLPDYAIGRYDEDRIGMYESDLFHNVENKIDGFAGKRTIHMGVDLQAPLHAPVHSFYEGTVHACGYNPALGDYGHVMVIHHVLPNQQHVYALYGHLDDFSASSYSQQQQDQQPQPQPQWKPGDPVQTGQPIGRLGPIHHNGGWIFPHVHFQLALSPPATHDMPGAVSAQDRPRALQEYPDPRYILGPLY